jgi:lysophospholipase L1-like esterase
MRRPFLKIGLFFAATLITFDIAEVIVRSVKPQLTFSEAFKLSGNFFLPDPVLPFTLPNNFTGLMQAYYGDYSQTVSTNNLGYRGKDFSATKPENTKRILVLGDSMTFGLGVSDSETYPAVLEEIIKKSRPDVEVINAGFTDGFAPDSYYVFLKDRGLALSPDAVIMGLFVWNDITDLSETVWTETDDQGLPTKVTSCCRVVDAGVLRNRHIAWEFQVPYLRESHLFILLAKTINEHFRLFPVAETKTVKRDLYQGCIFSPDCIGYFREEENKTFRVIGQIKKLADERKIPFFVVLIPVDFQLYPDAASKYGYLAYKPPADAPDFLQKHLTARLTAESVLNFDLYGAFDQQRERGYPYFAKDAHFNGLGNRIAAEAIYEYLKDKLNFL